jgi:hypothetical protein
MVTNESLLCSYRLNEAFLCKIHIDSIIVVRFEGKEGFLTFLKTVLEHSVGVMASITTRNRMIARILNVRIALARLSLSPRCYTGHLFIVWDLAPCESKAFLESLAVIRNSDLPSVKLKVPDDL